LRFWVRFGAVESTGEADASGWVVLHMRFDAQSAACQFALSWATQIEVLDPPELRQQVLVAARSIVEFYGEPASG
jgi:predicted DNA-binding transcriptional regulator YafY